MKTVWLWMDSFVGAIFLILAAIMYYFSTKIDNNDPFAMNPASYPIIIIAVIALLALIILAGGIKKGLHNAHTDDASTEIEEVSKANYNNPLKIILLLIAYVFGFAYIGFIVSTIAMVCVGTLMLGYRSYVRMAIASIVVTLIMYFGFAKLLLVSFPSGLLF